jgi:uncharacterized protein (DUF58 family)
MAAAFETTHRLRVAADAAVAQFPPLLVQARRIAATVALGSHGRRRAGPGESFWQFRPYARDDTPQSIDWRQTGKFDVVFVREREWVAAQTVALWCDTSPSMNYASRRTLPTKAERAAILTLALAELLVEGGERILRIAATGRPQRAAVTGRIAVAQLAEALVNEMTASAATTTSVPLRVSATLPRHSAVVMIGDLLAPLDETAANVKTLAQQGLRGHLLQVLDPAEESLPFKGRIRFVGMEAEGAAIVERTEDARTAYVRRMTEHREGLRDLAMRAGWTFAVHHTDRPPQLALAALHQALSGLAAREFGR